MRIRSLILETCEMRNNGLNCRNEDYGHYAKVNRKLKNVDITEHPNGNYIEME